MSWAQDQRQAFIRDTLQIEGRINRAAICDKFEVSLPIASADLARFAEENPGAAPYDESAKCYVANAALLPQTPRTPEQSNSALVLLLQQQARHIGFLEGILDRAGIPFRPAGSQ